MTLFPSSRLDLLAFSVVTQTAGSAEYRNKDRADQEDGDDINILTWPTSIAPLSHMQLVVDVNPAC